MYKLDYILALTAYSQMEDGFPGMFFFLPILEHDVIYEFL